MTEPIWTPENRPPQPFDQETSCTFPPGWSRPLLELPCGRGLALSPPHQLTHSLTADTTTPVIPTFLSECLLILYLCCYFLCYILATGRP
ncbi:hypothetical protein Pmani_030220 [Petrolisthes manimaculis]|uniref:Uncharacterized protein n=1 Tax=Petrolisthes manimaculis TaxID=1843537 RepID=A0AAE1NYF0_9EUCA|nr:hypothetical protein Pmani_030220 [Petrolisthes manimaculis]